MEKVQLAVRNEPIGKNTGLTFDPNTGERITTGELKRRQKAKQNKNSTKKNNKATNGIANNGPPPENAAHPEKNVPAPNLPKGWKKVQLEKNPKVVWYENEETGKEQWFVPGDPETDSVVLEDEEGLNSGWKRAYNARNNAEPKAIWYEHEDGRTQWERPASVVVNTNKNKNKINTRVPKPTGNALGNLKAQINSLGQTLDEMHSTLTKTQSGGRKKRRTTHRRKTRKSRR